MLSALSMAANGADKETLREMENVLGMPIEQLNKYIYSYVSNLLQSEKYKLSIANSIWINEDILVDEYISKLDGVQHRDD